MAINYSWVVLATFFLGLSWLPGALGQALCYQCANYRDGQRYDFCPLNDSVDVTKAYIAHCAGHCFSHNDDIAVMVRGCTTTQWGLPDPLPPDGCYTWKSRTWCICSTDRCNGARLGEAGSVSMDAHLHHDNGNNGMQGGSVLPPSLQHGVPHVAGVVLCWQCANYINGQHYDLCPLNASVEVNRAYIANCTGRCFSHNSTDHSQGIQVMTRGCTGLLWDLPNPLPPDGCYKWYSQIWCVCSQNGCNGARLGLPSSRKEFDYLDRYRSSNQGNTLKFASVHLNRVTVLFVAILSVQFK